VTELVTRAIGLLNQAMELDFKPYDRPNLNVNLTDPGWTAYSERALAMERARASMLRALATPEQRAAELADARVKLAEGPYGGAIGALQPVVDQLILELGMDHGGLRGLGLAPNGQSLDEIGRDQRVAEPAGGPARRGR
jgi:hypothetical protein